MKTIGQRINEFDNMAIQNVRTFNQVFPDVPLTGFNDNDTVTIGDITLNATTRNVTINNTTIEHSFTRRTTSENNYLDYAIDVDDNDDDWLFYFV